MGKPWETLLEQMVRERYPRLVAHAMLVARSRDDAQDLVQEALISVFSGRARFDSVHQAEAYVRRAIVSRAIDTSRRRAREQRAAARIGARPVTQPSIEAEVPSADVLRALASLSPRERACVVLRQLDDVSVNDTAELLGLSTGAVKRYTSDGIARLNAVLGSTAEQDVMSEVQLVSAEEVHGER